MNLKELGKEIESIDQEMILLIAQRMSLSWQVGMYKSQNNLPLIRDGVERKRINSAVLQGQNLGLDPLFVSSLMYNIIGESCKRQIKTIEKGKDQPHDVQ